MTNTEDNITPDRVLRQGESLTVIVERIRTETTIVNLDGFSGRPISALLSIIEDDPPHMDSADTTVRNVIKLTPVLRISE